MAHKQATLKQEQRAKNALSVAFTIICIIYIMPVVLVLINSFKSNSAVNMDTFALPNSETFMGFQNYIKGMTFGNYPFAKSVFYSFFMTLDLLGPDPDLLLHGGLVHRPGGHVSSARWSTTCVYSPWWCPSRWSCSLWPARRTALRSRTTTSSPAAWRRSA